MSFESRLNRLEEIVAKLENGAPDLDESLRLFEEGVAVLREASSELAVAEAKVKMLVEGVDGALELHDLKD
jgi:exodeoxyribonuclease VII small subunit